MNNYRYRAALIFIAIMLSLTAVLFIVDAQGKTLPVDADSKIHWVDPNTIKQGPIRHNTLTDVQTQRITKIKSSLQEVDAMPLEKWIDDFKRDANPDREIDIWEAISLAYLSNTDHANYDIDKKKEVFKVVLMSSMAPYDDAKSRMNVKDFSEDEIIIMYRSFSNYYHPTPK